MGDLIISDTPNPTGTEAAMELETNSGRTTGDITQLDRTPGVWVVDLPSHAAHLVAADGRGPIAWSPDGRRIAFLGPDDDLVTSPAAGGPAMTVAPAIGPADEGSLDLSPTSNGATILAGGRISGAERVETFPASGGAAKVIWSAPHDDLICGAVWSPDGDQFAVYEFVRNAGGHGDDEAQIEVGNADGSGLRTIKRMAGSCPSDGTFTWVAHFG